ncbi:hypothetical protein SAY86_015238 [Trapa natans]|uniref:Inositol polyphosphate-related phosphatase domain-containing protein n=1 Tax=Trapa natans TaxID=22666 RepID=A0AAN7KEE3_TRANT|nr:hypothetical protein SAY86_015238 [Trapa natans]
MRTEPHLTRKQSWPKVVARKWLNMRSRRADEFQADCSTSGTARIGRRKSCSDQDRYVIVPEELSGGWPMEAGNYPRQPLRGWAAPPPATGTHHQNLRLFVGTWNVGGRSPYSGLRLKDWLNSPGSADVYVLGFQEIVPLNAGNVLGAEDSGPAAKWLYLIRRALNEAGDFEQPSLEDDQLYRGEEYAGQQHRYCLAVSKQMVGLFMCVWVREDLQSHVSNLKVSCVGRGIMHYLGNKGSISISLTLHRTSFCFVCTHLASGEKEGDELRRNSDVAEILKKTKFSTGSSRSRSRSPGSILDHDKIIWLGDLNYRLSSSSGDMKELIKSEDWQALLEKDQLRIEQRAGRVFQGWEEGRIQFAPTYKYLSNSDHYAVQKSKSKEKRRTPAWCDRILWRGEGIKQMWYVRGESRFSDHRPVYSLFSVQVDLLLPEAGSVGGFSCPLKHSTTAGDTCASSMGVSAKVQAEELLLLTRVRSCMDSRTLYDAH